MNLFRKIERELILEWESLQLEKLPLVKALALKAYYIKYNLYRKNLRWQFELQAVDQI